ncbi:MAG: translation initiation factor IF-5A [Nanoarchaeota archaeon]
MEGNIKNTDAGSMQKGKYIILDGSACVCVNVQISRPGKHGHSKIRIEAVGLIDGKKHNVVMPGHDTVDVPIIEKKTAQVLSVTGALANVMDIESYETIDLAIPDELKDTCIPGCHVLYWVILANKVMKQVKVE